MPSGFDSLDEFMLLKENESELIIVGGRPSMGKSAFMFDVAVKVAERGHSVLVSSLEMSAKQIRMRLTAGRINRSLTSIQRGLVDNADLLKAKSYLNSLPYYIDDRSGITVHSSYDTARQAQKRFGTKVIFIDYLQLLRSERGHSKDDEIGTITRELKAMAKELKIPVIVGSQLNRACETRGGQSGDYKPQLSDLRESGNIEQDADMVLFVHRESRLTGARPGEADIIIAKNRNGPVGNIVMKFIETQTRFEDSGITL